MMKIGILTGGGEPSGDRVAAVVEIEDGLDAEGLEEVPKVSPHLTEVVAGGAYKC